MEDGGRVSIQRVASRSRTDDATDRVALSADPLTAKSMVIRDNKVLETIKDGKTIYPASN